ncbi:MAG: DUF503 domain-containing protein [Actinomycetota bacterium]
MFVGIARFELFVPAARSLKDKRQVVRSVVQQVKTKYPAAAVAEVDHQDLWQRTAIGVSCVAGTESQVRKVMQELEKTIGRAAIDGAEVVDRHIRFVSLEDL